MITLQQHVTDDIYKIVFFLVDMLTCSQIHELSLKENPELLNLSSHQV